MPARPFCLQLQAHEAQAGIEALALVLKGSKSKRVMNRKLYESGFYGSFFYHPVDVIENFIRQCIKSGLLATTDLGTAPYPTPVLTLTETCRMLLELRSVEEVARQRNIAASTVYDYLADGVQLGLISLDEIVSKEMHEKVRAAMKGETRMRDVKAKLPESISYGEIKCVIADKRRKQGFEVMLRKGHAHARKAGMEEAESAEAIKKVRMN